MSLYNHVHGKEAMLDGIAEALWDEVQLPDGETEWRKALRSFATSLTGMAHNHPHAKSQLDKGMASLKRILEARTPSR